MPDRALKPKQAQQLSRLPRAAVARHETLVPSSSHRDPLRESKPSQYAPCLNPAYSSGIQHIVPWHVFMQRDWISGTSGSVRSAYCTAQACLCVKVSLTACCDVLQTPQKGSPHFQKMLEEALNRGDPSAFAGEPWLPAADHC